MSKLHGIVQAKSRSFPVSCFSSLTVSTCWFFWNRPVRWSQWRSKCLTWTPWNVWWMNRWPCRPRASRALRRGSRLWGTWSVNMDGWHKICYVYCSLWTGSSPLARGSGSLWHSMQDPSWNTSKDICFEPGHDLIKIEVAVENWHRAARRETKRILSLLPVALSGVVMLHCSILWLVKLYCNCDSQLLPWCTADSCHWELSLKVTKKRRWN